MKKFFASAVLFAAALFTANAQQLQTGDTFEYTNSEGVVKTYKVVGENLIENPSFDNGTTGWTGGGGGALGNTEVNYSGGVDGGAYIRPTSSSGKGDNNSIGTAWDVEVGKTYVFSFFMKNQSNTAAESPAGDGYIKVSMSDTYREETLVLQPLPHVDADLAWTQNTWVVTAEYTSLALCARWLGGAKCFDAFILAEVEEAADTKELEDLLAQCAEWMDYFGDDAKEYDTFNAVAEKGQALVDGGEYTAADLNAMVHELKEALLDFRVANASDENPVDVTDRYIKNTKFNNLGTDWNPVNSAVNNGINFRNFAYFEQSLNPVCEINGVPSAESSISQTVYNLPMGYYRFTVQAVMSHSVDVSDPEAKSGAIIFCNGSELDMVTKEQTAGGAANDASYPETFTIQGIVSADSIVVGFKGLTSASFSYVAIDNVKLEYAGFDAGIYIDALASQIWEWVAENGDYLLPAIAFLLEEEISAAEDAIGTTDEEMAAAYKKLDAAFTDAKHSIEAMKQLEEDYSNFAVFVEETSYPGMDAALAVVSEVEAFLEMEDEEASYDELNAMIAKLAQAKNDYRMSQIATKEEPADYTFLLPNANFEAQGNWVWNVTQSGGGTDTWVGGCRPTVEGGENRRGVNLWGNHLTSLDLHQDLVGLPNGLYGISAELITQAGYATDQHLYVSGINKAVSANLDVEGWDSYQWTTLQTPYVVVI
ncbi:MAG: carbohydrate binding domain-containing protein, partial [Bacteroidaceae bacterium]|nr:carbohydrate binding domain-containing protein [Bacteroidaceae bacterium]